MFECYVHVMSTRLASLRRHCKTRLFRAKLKRCSTLRFNVIFGCCAMLHDMYAVFCFIASLLHCALLPYTSCMLACHARRLERCLINPHRVPVCVLRVPTLAPLSDLTALTCEPVGVSFSWHFDKSAPVWGYGHFVLSVLTTISWRLRV